MKQKEKREYTYKELEEIREELGRKVKKKVFLEIEENYYREDFYEKSPVHSLLFRGKEDKGINYNKELYKKYGKESIHENIKRIMAAVGYNNDAIIFKPEKYNEEEALRCGLMPFKYVGGNREREIKLVMLCVYPDCAFFIRPRLDAYQALMSGTISQRNVLESNEKYFKEVVGEGITEEVKKRLKKRWKIYFYFQNGV